jgi:type I restriction enzyme S subunit
MSGAVPALRFPGFEGEWEPKTVGEIAQISKGKGISKADIVIGGETPCVRYGELYTTYDTKIEKIVSFTDVPVSTLKISAGGEVIIPASGETPEDIATAAVVVDSGVALGGDLNVLTTASNGHFLALYFSGKKRMALASMAQGNSVVHLYPTQISSLEIGVPSLPEQTKIAEFLGVVDAKLTALMRKKGGLETFKSGLMQQLFTQTLRFTRDDGTDFPDWEEKTLGDISSMQAGKFMAASEIRPLSEEFLFPCFGGNGLRGYVSQHNQDGQFALIGRQGALCGNVHFASGKFYATEHAIVVSAKGGTMIGWLFHLLAHMRLNQYATGLAQPGLAADNLKKLEMELPHPDEQRKIADALSALDAKIGTVAGQIAHMQTFKQGLLQQMFV